jgi:hypothetical protein
VKGNEEIFDAWLQKQSSFNFNKENHSYQQKVKSKI